MFEGSERRLEMTICCVFFLARCSRFCVDARWNTDWFSPGWPPLLFLLSSAAPAPMAPPGGRVALLEAIV